MTQEEKQLLLKDLCARLPYNVKVRIQKLDEDKIIDNEDFGYMWLGIVLFDNPYHQVKPYLRPMSSMTFEEMREFLSTKNGECEEHFLTTNKQDWLNEHHFDYRGLIEKGLALEAPEEMYGKI